MPDITMCNPKATDEPQRTCPRAARCYRHTAKPSRGRQSYFARLPLLDTGLCDHWWPLPEEPRQDEGGGA